MQKLEVDFSFMFVLLAWPVNYVHHTTILRSFATPYIFCLFKSYIEDQCHSGEQEHILLIVYQGILITFRCSCTCSFNPSHTHRAQNDRGENSEKKKGEWVTDLMARVWVKSEGKQKINIIIVPLLLQINMIIFPNKQ